MPRRGTVEIEGLSLPALSKNNPALAYLQPYAITSNVEADFELDDSGALTRDQVPSRWLGRGRNGGRQDAVAHGQVRRRGQL